MSLSAIAFGSVDVLTNPVVDAAGSVTASCSGLSGSDNARICIELGTGTYPLSGGWRQMGSGANRLLFQVYNDASRTVVWDTSASGTVIITLDKFTTSATVPTYGRVPSGQQIVPVGSYVTNVASNIRWATYHKNFAPPACTSIPISSTPAFSVTATVTPSCTATVSNMNFGSRVNFNTVADATATVSVICTNGAPYNVRLNGGGSGNVNARRMVLGGNQISYGLYRNSTRTLNWGQTDGVDTDPGTGTASSVLHTIYRRIPVQATPPGGTYLDTVIMTVSY